MKWINNFGLYTRQQYEELRFKYEKVMAHLGMEAKQKDDKIYNLNEELKLQPFKFDYLIGCYSDNQLNSLFYKLVNFVRNDKSKVELLDRWYTRINSAKDSLK